MELVPAMETTVPAMPLSMPMKRKISAPAEKAPPANIMSSEVKSKLNSKNPQKAIKIQVTPKMNSATKLIFINTMELSLSVQYLDKVTLIPNKMVVAQEARIIIGVTEPTP